MNHLRSAVAACVALAWSPWAAAVPSESVVLLLRTYSSVTSADEGCLHAGPTEADVTTLRLTCPSSVGLDAQANVQAGWSLAHQQLAAGPFVLNHYRLSNAGAPAARSTPLLLQLTW